MPITDQAAEAFIRAKDGLDAATAVATIQKAPQSKTESLNVATAAAMLLYEAHR